jgi:hypothetical protein
MVEVDDARERVAGLREQVLKNPRKKRLACLLLIKIGNAG